MKCKDCVCSDVCYYKAFNDVRHVKRRDDVEKICKSFINRDSVEVVHGRWETANDGTHFCSHCGCDAPYTWDDIDRSFINSADDVPDRPSNYCHNCGAKMDGYGNG